MYSHIEKRNNTTFAMSYGLVGAVSQKLPLATGRSFFLHPEQLIHKLHGCWTFCNILFWASY